MEISGKVLREVEFRDRLRGYDTDEVDEFLEKVAVAVDELRAELEQALRRAERHPGEAPAPAARPVAEPALDDDAIRRTLVLAQRTADLAIAEAREEASRLLEDARTEAAETLGHAEETARRTREDADTAARERLEHLATEQARLEGEIERLAEIVNAERTRLTDSLTRVLRSIGDAFAAPEMPAPPPVREVVAPAPVPEEVAAEAGAFEAPSPDEAAPDEALREAPAPGADPLGVAEPGAAPGAERVPDVESEIAEDAAAAYGGGFFGGSTGRVRALGEEEADAEEELWQRWAAGRDLGVVPGPSDLAAGARRGRRPDGGLSA